MLTDSEKDYVTLALLAKVAVEQNQIGYISAGLPPIEFASQLPAAPSPKVLVNAAVTLCMDDAWKHNPTWMYILLQKVAPTPEISAILTRIQIPPPQAPQWKDVRILDNGVPFLDRTEFRDSLDELHSDVSRGRPVMVLTGGPGIGKTYSDTYIDYFVRKTPNLFRCRAVFDQEQAGTTGAADIARSLAQQIGASVEDLPGFNTNAKKYGQELALWLLNKAAREPQKKFSFVLDNFSGDSLPPGVGAFVVALADAITNGVFPLTCRLVLIGWDSAQLITDDFIEEELDDCTDLHVQECVVEILELARPPLPADAAGPVTKGILKGIPRGRGWLQEVNRRLRMLIYIIPELNALLAGRTEDYLAILLEVIASFPPDANWKKKLAQQIKELKEDIASISK